MMQRTRRKIDAARAEGEDPAGSAAGTGDSRRFGPALSGSMRTAWPETARPLVMSNAQRIFLAKDLILINPV